MRAQELVEILLQSDGPTNVRALLEASVHLPRRSGRWVAAFQDATGRRTWRSTGLRDHNAALALARAWEAEARRKRAAQGARPIKPTIRVRPGSREQELGLLTQREVAAMLKISERAVREIERRAFEKLRRHPALRDLWRKWTAGNLTEADSDPLADGVLSQPEMAALYALAWTPTERQALSRLLALRRRD